MRVAVVGAGIGGLAATVCLRAAGAAVVIFEQAHRIGEVGAGIQLAPNATRALASMGVIEAVRPRAVAAASSLRRRWQDGQVLGRYPLGAEAERRWQAPYWHAHRADLHAALLAAAVSQTAPGQPAELRLGQRVTSVDPGSRRRPARVTTTADSFDADVVVGADGIHSRVRRSLAGEDASTFSGDVAYRALIPAARLRENADVAALTAQPELNIWLGPNSHIVHYYVRRRALLNLVALVPGDHATPESWSARTEVSELLSALAGWAEPVRRLIAYAPGLSRSAVHDREPLNSWVSGRVALLGDACHPMLPYQAQGAAQALEDALALAAELSEATPDTAADALRAYEVARLPRASAVQRASRHNRELFHLPDGQRQQERDRLLRAGQGDFDAYAWLWSGAPPPPAG